MGWRSAHYSDEVPIFAHRGRIDGQVAHKRGVNSTSGVVSDACLERGEVHVTREEWLRMHARSWVLIGSFRAEREENSTQNRLER